MGEHRYKIELECGHYLWYHPPIPNLTEILWCRYCKDERRQAKADAHYAESYQDDWLSQRKGRNYVGTCLITKADGSLCNDQLTRTNWYKLRDDIERHQLVAHTDRFANLRITEVDRLPKNATPDF
jgi:hypothetical protein